MNKKIDEQVEIKIVEITYKIERKFTGKQTLRKIDFREEIKSSQSANLKINRLLPWHVLSSVFLSHCDIR